MVEVIITRKNQIWYKERKIIAKTAAKILNETIQNYIDVNSTYPTADDVNDVHDMIVYLAFIKYSKKSSLKQMYLSQAVFSATSPRLDMQLKLGQVVTAGNRPASKQLNNLLKELVLAVNHETGCCS